MRAAVLLSGSGYLDGSEIHESTLSLLYLDKNNVKTTGVTIFDNQFHVIDHHEMKPITEQNRKLQEESARITRSPILDITRTNSDQFDMLIVPGGFGVAKNLTSYAFQGKGYSVNDDVKKFILDFHKSKKPMVFMCISPIIPAKLFKNVQLTVGNDQEVKEVLELQGAQIRDCAPEDIIVDEENLIVSTPAYMQSTTISKISVGIEKAVEAAIELTKIKTPNVVL